MTVDTRLRIGDDVVLQGIAYRLTGLDGDVALLSAAGEPPVAIKVGALFADESFKVTNKRVGRRRVSDPSLLFDSLPPEIQTKARQLERHITEILDGDGTVPVPSRATRCALERTGTLRVEIYTTHDQVLCPRHRLWTGEGVHGPTEQLSIQAAPEVLAAWHHHKNLVTRFGRSGVRKAFHIAGIINWRWYDQFHHFTPALDTYDALAGNQPRNANSHAAVAAALYPSVVALAAIMASPYWARIAHSGRPAQFLERVTSEVTDGWAPTGAADTLRFWMNEDWLPGFRGSDRLPGKVSPESPVQLGQFRVSSVS